MRDGYTRNAFDHLSCRSHEVVWVEFVVPVGLIIGFLHAEGVVVDALVVPLTHLIENVHLLGVDVGIDHVKVQAGVLLEEGAP